MTCFEVTVTRTQTFCQSVEAATRVEAEQIARECVTEWPPETEVVEVQAEVCPS